MSVIDEYLATVPPAQKTELERVRQIIKQQVPDAVEVITYGIPGFKINGKYLIAFAGFKNHMSIFPGASPTHAVKEKLKGNKTSKGTIQFTLDNPLPEPLIKEIVQLCLDRNAAA
ncbi:MAG: DUF1801 domain-containing protein [Patescibacteria group bacterium]